MSRIDLDNGSFITYEGIARDGHWNPGGTEAEDAQGVIAEFRKADAGKNLSGLVHDLIADFDLSTLKEHGEDAYQGTGYYPQLTWMALERSGLWVALDGISDGNESFRLHQYLDKAGLVLPDGVFKMATE